MGIFDKDLIRFLLLSGYSQEKVGLMYQCRLVKHSS